MDMEQDAVQVRPLRQITGESEFNELFIEEARIADEHVVGGVGNGWKVALTTLMNERAGLAFFLQVRLRQLLDDLIAEAAARGRLEDDLVADRLGELHVRTEMLRLTAYRGLTAIEKYGQPGPEGSLTKWMWSDTNQQLAQLAADILGPDALVDRHARGRTSCCARAATRSRAAPPRSSRTSSPSACSACRGLRWHGLRLHRRPAADQGARRASCSPSARPSPRVRAAAEARVDDAALWAELRELGWPGIAVAEEHGGQGLGAVELAILLEELGYAVAATPFLGTALAALAIQHGGQRRAARALAAGARVRRADRRLRPARPRGRRRRRRRDRPRRATAAARVLVDGADADVEPLDTIDPTRRYAQRGGARGPRSAATSPTAAPARSRPSSSASASARWT